MLLISVHWSSWKSKSKFREKFAWNKSIATWTYKNLDISRTNQATNGMPHNVLARALEIFNSFGKWPRNGELVTVIAPKKKLFIDNAVVSSDFSWGELLLRFWLTVLHSWYCDICNNISFFTHGKYMYHVKLYQALTSFFNLYEGVNSWKKKG